MTTWKRYGAVAAVLLVAWSVSCGDDATGPQFAARMYIGDIGTGVAATTPVLIYRSPYTPSGGPSDSVKRGTTSFYGVTLDANGNLAASVDSLPSRIYFYDAPVSSSSTPRDSLSYPAYGQLLKFGPGGKLFVPTGFGYVFVYTPPFTSASPRDTIATDIGCSFSIAFDATNRLYAGDQCNQAVRVYDSPYTGAAAFAVTNGLSSGLVAGIAVDADGRLFVADVFGSQILVFEPPLSAASTPSFAITIGIDSPVGSTIGPDGALYVTNLDGTDVPSITLYQPPFSARSAPTITMSGGGRLVSPYGIAVGPR